MIEYTHVDARLALAVRALQVIKEQYTDIEYALIELRSELERLKVIPPRAFCTVCDVYTGQRGHYGQPCNAKN